MAANGISGRYTAANLINDSESLKLSLTQALTSEDQAVAQRAWLDTIVNVAKIAAGLDELISTDPRFAGSLGTGATYGQLGLAAMGMANSAMANSAMDNGLGAIKVTDALSMIGAE